MIEMNMKSETIFVECIHVGDRLRRVDAAKVDAIAESIKSIGLQSPISVRVVAEHVGDDGVISTEVPVLVAGLHRLEAMRQLGKEEIEAHVFEGDELEARKWEVAENLHRSDLTAQERADHIAEWVRLTDLISGQSDQKSKRKPTRAAVGVARGGLSAVVRELGIDRNEARRAVKIASITPEARTAADDAGLVSQTARLEIAKADDQVAKIQELKLRAENRKPGHKAANDIVHSDTVADDAARMILDCLSKDKINEMIKCLELSEPRDIAAAMRRMLRGG